MRILIDFQGAQSGSSRNRGIGRYTRALTKAIIRNNSDHEILIALSGLFPETIELIRSDFDGILPQENIRVWHAPESSDNSNSKNNWRRKSSELLREAFLANQQADVVLVSSLFEGLDSNAITSIGTLRPDVPTAVILYDLIPFLHQETYLSDPDVATWYESKLDHLRRSDLLLAISESSRNECIEHLGFNAKSVINISTAADSHFRPVSIDDPEKEDFLARFNLHQPYVMYTGGIDHRKNIDRLIRSFAQLPSELQKHHQLVIVCAISNAERLRLNKYAKKCRLKQDQLVFTGYVSEDDLLILYNLCRLFVFPSWHEGFGLPALEAMSCGKPVIGSNTSSVPEVIGRSDALFDPGSDEAITAKLQELLTNKNQRMDFGKYGLERSKDFSWDKSAVRAIEGLEQLHLDAEKRRAKDRLLLRRPRLAFVSPLPPERSGISDYSAALIPELARHYNIDVIVSQEEVSSSSRYQLRDTTWFEFHASEYDRVIYHFGNSPFHLHMFNLLDKIPGVVVLHDFFLSSVISHLDYLGMSENLLERELYHSHGYDALQNHYLADKPTESVWEYPCNRSVLQKAQGIIVHSSHSRQLTEKWYGPIDSSAMDVIPLLRVPPLNPDKPKARKKLNIKTDAFVVCCFGMIGPTKMNHRLLSSWLASNLAKDPRCLLVFVGENTLDEYGLDISETVRHSGHADQIVFTGWTDSYTYINYCAAADLAVQLRCFSRGETSASVLDCMNYGLPTIYNANGAMAEIPDQVAWKLADNFEDNQLVQALETLWSDKEQQTRLGEKAKEFILEHNMPRDCANKYALSIENFHQDSTSDIHSLTRRISQISFTPKDSTSVLNLAKNMAQCIRPRLVQKQLFLDISTLVQTDAGTGVQRVVRSVLHELLTQPPKGFRVEPVYASIEHGYRYARQFTLNFLNCPVGALEDEPIEYQSGDKFLGLDLLHNVVINHRGFFQEMRREGVYVSFVVYDLLCVLFPELFDFGEDAADLHNRWLEVVTESDAAICISESVVNEVKTWMVSQSVDRQRPIDIPWFHLGADLMNSVPSSGLPEDADEVLSQLDQQTSFLMVGTIEPRKRHEQTLAAFELLWENGLDANLVIVGRQGWQVDAFIDKLLKHPQQGKSLFWLKGISDEYIERIYSVSDCLISASIGEGFGLPLIESARKNIPIIARDIPVFKEVAGDNAFYFRGDNPKDISTAIQKWLGLFGQSQQPVSKDIPWLTWQQSTQKLLEAIKIDTGTDHS